jgi:oxygen-independent coproporphyrinogen III oxidase
MSFPGMDHIFARYIEALEKEITLQTSNTSPIPLTTIFFGGGTPSLLPAADISRVLRVCQERFQVDKDAEISMEINPKTVDFMKLLSIREAGVNRISAGVQSFVDKDLKKLGRLHNAQQAIDAITLIRNAGFGNINIDLIFGLPGQNSESWKWSLQTAIALRPTHLSLYQLSVEEKTSFWEQFQKGSLILPEEEEIERMDVITEEVCRSAGYRQYEISNYARPGYECRHNINYWENKDYYAVGAGSVRYLDGERAKNVEDPIRYCEYMEGNKNVVQESEQLDKEASFRETVVMGLRMVTGVSMENLRSRYGIELRSYYKKILGGLLQNGLVAFNKDLFYLTSKGRLIANKVMADLV